jgi:hypothetical protein
MPTMDMATGQWEPDANTLQVEIRRLRQELVQARHRIQQLESVEDTRNHHMKATWFEALVQACDARGFRGDRDRPFNGPFKLVDEYDRIMGPVTAPERTGRVVGFDPPPQYSPDGLPGSEPPRDLTDYI